MTMSKGSRDHSNPRRVAKWQLWWHWILATTIGELFGFGLISVVGVAVSSTSNQSLQVLLILAGILEGAAIGLAQWLVLRHYLPNSSLWVVATAGGAFLCWIMGMIPSTLLSLDETETIALEAVSYLMILVIGAFLGAVLGFTQWLVLKIYIPRSLWWILGNAIGWSISIAIAFIGIDKFQAEDTFIQVVFMGAVIGIAMGLMAGAITGIFLVWLMNNRLQL